MKKIGIQTKIDSRILKIAKQVRRWVLERNGDSDGMCSDASSELHRKLKRIGIKSRFVTSWFYVDGGEEEGHCWIEIGKNILDVTADQFNRYLKENKMGAIVFGRINDLRDFYSGL